MTANVLVTKEGIKALESENIGQRIVGGTVLTLIVLIQRLVERNYVTSTDSFASGENLEKCDSS